ncbi:DUF6861 domain-containing protein [Methylobacter sp.]|uniref:DUF6861 domain-containing protein n=1 Tax=Methylobacter sp. TaxID=2051955 RepID=UPI003DA3F986
MANDFPKTPYDAWQLQRCHPNAPAGGGGPGCFTSADPFLRSSSSGWQSLPHPDSPGARYLTPQEIRAPDITERVRAVVQAYTRALRLAPAAVYRETGCQLDQIIDGLLPGLLQMLAALGISAMAGASAGAAVGFFLGGVGVAPGAIVGGELGLEAGTALLAWMGLGFLAAAIGQGMGELTGVLKRAIRCAWHAPEHRYPPFEIDRAAEDLARAVGILFRLILQGLLAYVLKNGAVSASRAVASTSRTIISGGTGAAADATLAEVSALLRKSKLPDGFIVWLERNWDDLKRNPKLASNKTGPAVSSQSSSAATPSELKAMRERQGRADIAEASGNNSRPVVERANHEKVAFDEQTVHDRMTGKEHSGAPNNTDNVAAPGPVNFMADSDRFFINASKRTDIDPDGYFDVVAHGSPNKIQIETPNGPVLVDHRAAARLIKQQPGYNGQNIRLFSCSTGACDTGFAQNLANKLNVEVQAPTDLLWAYSNGKTLVAPKAINGQPDISNLGKIKVFLPKRSQ